MNPTKNIYLDYAATTPVDPRVMEAMRPYFTETFGNPSSVHRYGQQAEAALENARESIAQIFNCLPGEIIFTSCGTESDNLAIRGSALLARQNRGANHILITPVEHHAVTRTAQQLSTLFGFELEYLPVDKYGQTHPDDVASRLRQDTAVISVIYANNEIGTINPIAEIAALCRTRGIIFHTDGVQAAAYLPLNVDSLNADLISIGAHKFYGPKGIGALYKRNDIQVFPTQTGGSQEFGLRAGTQNIPYIIGMAEALRLAQEEREARSARLIPMRGRLIGTILEEISEVQLTGHPTERLPNHASFIFKGIDGNALLTLLDIEGFACSSGSACKTGDPEPSEVLTSLGLSRDWTLGSLRVTLGSDTSPSDIESFLTALPRVINKLRNLN